MPAPQRDTVGMDETQPTRSKRYRPAFRRAFLTTTAVVGAFNAALFLYFLSLPDDGSILVMGEWGSWTVRGRVTPDWYAVLDIVNFPGRFIGRSCLNQLGLWLPNQVSSVLFNQIAGTLFWGCIAMVIEGIGAAILESNQSRSTRSNDDDPASRDS